MKNLYVVDSPYKDTLSNGCDSSTVNCASLIFSNLVEERNEAEIPTKIISKEAYCRERNTFKIDLPKCLDNSYALMNMMHNHPEEKWMVFCDSTSSKNLFEMQLMNHYDEFHKDEDLFSKLLNTRTGNAVLMQSHVDFYRDLTLQKDLDYSCVAFLRVHQLNEEIVFEKFAVDYKTMFLFVG